MADEYQGIAIYQNSEIYADSYSVDEWNSLKASYKIGEITMPCCNAPAVLKTSQNGLQFFAHHNDECVTAPETIWHRETKTAIQKELQGLGINAELEFSNKKEWKADVYFEYKNSLFAIEIQRSYQHLDEYLKRQLRYEEGGVKAFWVLSTEQFLPLTKAMGKRRLIEEFKGKRPEDGFYPCLSTIPIVHANGSPLEIKGVGLYQSSVQDWLLAVIQDRFQWHNGQWRDMR